MNILSPPDTVEQMISIENSGFIFDYLFA